MLPRPPRSTLTDTLFPSTTLFLSVFSACKNKGLVKGGTTPDGLFTLTEVECLGACANAPMVQINDDNFEDLTYDSMSAILDDLAVGKQPRIGPQIDRQTRDRKSGV